MSSDHLHVCCLMSFGHAHQVHKAECLVYHSRQLPMLPPDSIDVLFDAAYREILMHGSQAEELGIRGRKVECRRTTTNGGESGTGAYMTTAN